LFLWTKICLEVMCSNAYPSAPPPREENRTQTLKAEFQGSVSSFWRILYIDRRTFLFLPLLYLEQQQLKQQRTWLVHVSTRNSSGVHCNVFMCLNLLKCKYIRIFKVWCVCFLEMVRDICTVVTSRPVSCYIPQERCCSVGWTEV
jgi:hypothetical protein